MFRALLFFASLGAVFAPIWRAEAARMIPVDVVAGGQDGDSSPSEGLTVGVRDERGPVADAAVLVETLDGLQVGTGQTNASGESVIAVSPAVLAGGVHVTATAKNHVPVSFLGNIAPKVILELATRQPDGFAMAKGSLFGFDPPPDNSNAMVGMVSRVFEMGDLVQMDPSLLMSPLNDKMDIYGQRDVPSNLVIPDQTIPIYFIPTRLSKPNYRLPVTAGGQARFFGVTGTINVSEALGALRAGNNWEILNHLKFGRAGISPVIGVPDKAGEHFVLDVVARQPIRDSRRFRVGRNARPECAPDCHRVLLSLWEAAPERFVPTDVKLLDNASGSNGVSVSVQDRRSSRVIDVVIGKGAMHFRGEWLSNAATAIGANELAADVMVENLRRPWLLRGGERAQVLVAHLESKADSSIGTPRILDQWVLVGAKSGTFQLPALASGEILAGAGRTFESITHVSVDWIQMGGQGKKVSPVSEVTEETCAVSCRAHQNANPALIRGKNAVNEVVAIEKVRKEIH